MPVYYNKHGRAIDTSFLRLLFDYNQPRTIRQPKPLKKVQLVEAPVITTTPPAPAATAPLPAASPAAPPAPAASPSKPEPAGEAKAAEAVPAWTEIQDAILLGSKSQGKEWKAIAALVDGKGPKELKARYKELTATASKADDTTEGEATEDESNGKKKQKAKNGKGKEPTDKNEVNEDSGKKGKAKAKNDDGKRLKGILRTDDDSSNDPTFEGRSIIFLDEDGNLTAAELLYLFKLERKLEKRMWLELASKLFDKTGKRMSPDLVQETLMNCMGR